MKLSIIIVSYNTKDILDDCLSSIYRSHIKDVFEIIVVDNCSHDGSVEMLETKYKQVTVIKNTVNHLFAKANNQAAKIAKGEYLLLLNSDTLVYDDNIQKLIDYFETLESSVICIGPKILNLDKSLQSQGYPNPSIMERLTMCFKLYKFLPYFLLPMGVPIKKNIPRRVGWVAGACMMIRKSKYIEINGLNEKVEFYGEEPEFGYRTTKLGYQTWYYPFAEIIHLGGKSSQNEIISRNNPEHQKVRLRRYSLLQRETVGYKKAIYMSEVVLFAAYIKKIISSDKAYFQEAIIWEKKVIKYLRDLLYEEVTH